MAAHAVVVGAGPAGLYCASTLADGGFKGDITVLERGQTFESRFLSRDDWTFDPHAVLEGEGGPGFLADAKLCLSPTAGAQFSTDLAAQYPRALSDLDTHIWQCLLDLGHEIRRAQPHPDQHPVVRDRLRDVGLDCETYTVRPLGSDMAATFLREFVDDMQKRGVEFRYGSQVTGVRIGGPPDQYFLTVHDSTGERVIEATHLVLAVGWIGSADLCEFDLGLEFEPNNLDIGVRLEFPAWGGNQLKEAGHNPKIKWHDGHSYAKTHCFVHEGEVFFYYLNDRCLVDAHAVRSHPTRSSSVNILYRISTDAVSKPLHVFHAIAAAAEVYGDNMPLYQRLADFAPEVTLASDVVEFVPTLAPPASAPCDLTLVLPHRVVEGIRGLIARLACYAPGITTESAVVYAPAAQWLMRRVRLDPQFRIPEQSNGWCIGDGTGLTAGVLPAAVSGVVAARDAIAQQRGTVQDAFWSFP